VIDPPTSCECCDSNRLRKLGEDVTRTSDSVPRQWKVIETVREKFSCRDCEKISQAPGPTPGFPAQSNTLSRQLRPISQAVAFFTDDSRAFGNCARRGARCRLRSRRLAGSGRKFLIEIFGKRESRLISLFSMRDNEVGSSPARRHCTRLQQVHETSRGSGDDQMPRRKLPAKLCLS